MKYLALSLSVLTLTLLSCTHKKKIKTDLETLHYKGKVKSIIYNVYKAIEKTGGKLEKGDLMSKVESECDMHGNFTSKTNYRDNKLITRTIRKYDTAGNVIEEIRVQQAIIYLGGPRQDNDSLSEDHIKYTYKFDEKGNKAEVKTTKNDKPLYREVNTFDDKGNLTLVQEYVPWDSLAKKEVNIKNKKNNLTEKSDYDKNGKLLFKYTYKYDDNGNITQLQFSKPDGTMEATETMKYDENDNVVADTRTMPDGKKNFDWRYEFQQYDKTGNWIKEISYSNDKPQAITERRIEYY